MQQRILKTGNLNLSWNMGLLFAIGMLMMTVYVLQLGGRGVGYVFLWLPLSISLFFTVQVFVSRGYRFSRQLVTLSIPWLILIALYVLAMFTGFPAHGITNIIQLVAIYLFFMLMCVINWDTVRLRQLAVVTSLYVLVFFAVWIKTHFIADINGLLDNYNPCGFVLEDVGFIQLFAVRGVKDARWRAFHWIVAIICFIFMPASGARSTVIEFLVALIAIGLWKWIIKNRTIYWAYMMTVILFIIAFTLVYPIMGKRQREIQGAVEATKVTGGNLFSGRQQFWGTLEHYIKITPFTGEGAGAEQSDFTTNPLSCHSLYLQIGLQTGVPGIICLFGIFCAVWQVCWKGRHNFYAKFAAGLVTGTMAHQMFEVSLIQNNLACGVYQFLVIAIPVSYLIAGVERPPVLVKQMGDPSDEPLLVNRSYDKRLRRLRRAN